MAEPEKKTPAETAAQPAEGGEKKLSAKELKELKKKEKAAKRAAQKEANGITPEQQKKLAEQKIEKKKQQLQQSAASSKKQASQTTKKEERRVPAVFGHLETREQRNASSSAPSASTISNIIHPAILSLTLKYSNYKVVGSSSRLKNMLLAFKQVVQDYSTPENTTLTRHLTAHLSNQIEYLKTGRPLSVSMGNAIRWLKQEISVISIDTSEANAKEILCTKIDDFIKEKIELSDTLIVESASKHIANGSTILTYGHSQVLEELFKFCVLEQNKKFNLIVVDSRPLFEGKRMVKNLINTYLDDDEEDDIPDEFASVSSRGARVKVPITKDHISIQYALINSLSSTLLDDVDCVFLGAHAMLSNGRLYSRVGTALVAMMCHTRNIPVLTCCESIKFSEKVQLDSITTNELGDAEDLIQDIDCMRLSPKKSFALEQFLKETEPEKKAPEKPAKGKGDQAGEEEKDGEDDSLENWKEIANLSVVNILYDLTPPEYINKVITELGALPPSSVPVILREYKNT
ncbi:Translation initiation factor eIF-2B subunit delta [Candida viswanathii]|uniref:Translation initiation factor eIF2B subunit delta n=1 Tax=Candida viswanathii TaxID=5486 RepID=A0A367YHF4_9ASCO|nr:Translation initiation factor eIF-2B subunit delta [Candida viswanathii]